jgi:hypothetical protein
VTHPIPVTITRRRLGTSAVEAPFEARPRGCIIEFAMALRHYFSHPYDSISP